LTSIKTVALVVETEDQRNRGAGNLKGGDFPMRKTRKKSRLWDEFRWGGKNKGGGLDPTSW